MLVRIGTNRARVFNRDMFTGQAQQLCCQSCEEKSEQIGELGNQIDTLKETVETLQVQRDQHEKALRYLFQKVELMLL